MGYYGWGYGSHSSLNECIIRNRCKKIMEIGVADGANARTMVMVANQNFPAREVEYYGFDIFGWNNDFRLKQVKQKLERTGCIFRLFKGDSIKTLPKIVKTLPKMDLIFIDGGHSYPTVKSDWENSKSLIYSKTAVFFHNYDFSGPKRVVDNISREKYLVKIIHPQSDTQIALVKKKNTPSSTVTGRYLKAKRPQGFFSKVSLKVSRWLWKGNQKISFSTHLTFPL